MPIVSGAYVSPSWANGTSPYINASELQAMSDSIACLPVANGGTGATSASAALTALGAVPLSNVTSKGSNNRPVFFNSSGIAAPIDEPLPLAYGGTGQDNHIISGALGDYAFPSGYLSDGWFRKWGRVVTLYAYTSIMPSSGRITIDSFYGNSIMKPNTYYYGLAVGVTNRSVSNDSECVYSFARFAYDHTSDTFSLYPAQSASRSLYYQFTITYLV